MEHGPWHPTASWVTAMPFDVAGKSWDGGPAAVLPLLRFDDTLPALSSDVGDEDAARFMQTPSLELADEGAVGVVSVQDRIFDERVERVVNGWWTYGPIAGPSKLFSVTLTHRRFFAPTTAVQDTMYAGIGKPQGNAATLFVSEVTFRKSCTVQWLHLLSSKGDPPTVAEQAYR